MTNKKMKNTRFSTGRQSLTYTVTRIGPNQKMTPEEIVTVLSAAMDGIV